MIKRNKIIFVLLASILIIAFIKTIFPVHKSNKDIIDEFWVKKTHQKAKNNIVLIGDSRIYRGISTEALLSTIDQPLSAVNLGYSSVGYNTEYLNYALSRLDVDAKLKVIVLGITPFALTEEACRNKQFNELKTLEYVKVFRILYLNDYLSIAPYKPMELISSYHPKDSFIVNNGYYQRYNPDGWVASYRVPFDSTRAKSSYIKSFTKWKVSKSITDSLIHNLEAVIKHDITVFAFRPPTTAWMEQLEDSLGGFDEASMIEELQRIGVIWLDFNNKDYVSYDGSHLHYQSARRLSQQLGKAINQHCLKNATQNNR